VVFHAAALSSPWGDRRLFEAINVTATERLLAAAAQAGADSFVHVSSPSIYARLRDQTDLTEADPPAARPINDYARTKGLSERRVREAARPGFATVALRPRAIVSPHETVLLPRLAALAGRGRIPLLRGGQALVEFTDARDVAHALILADRRREAVSGRVINISSGRPVSILEVSRRLALAMERPVRFRAVPVAAALALAAGSEVLARLNPSGPEPPLTRYGVATLAYSQTFDLGLARRALGYAPRRDALQTLLDAAARRYGPESA
jgi:nucleoside-diphosphate-sugar epimerase